MVLYYRKYWSRHEVAQLKRVNLEIVINYLSSFEFSPLKTHSVWSHKRIWNKSTPFHVFTVWMFQRHQTLSIHPPVELFAYYVFLCDADRRWSPQGTRPQCVHRLDFIKVQKIAPDRDHWAPRSVSLPLFPPSLCLTWQTELLSRRRRLNIKEKNK